MQNDAKSADAEQFENLVSLLGQGLCCQIPFDLVRNVAKSIGRYTQEPNAIFNVATDLLTVRLCLSGCQVIERGMVYPKLNIRDRGCGVRRISIVMILIIVF